jgi:hypothetical protein
VECATTSVASDALLIDLKELGSVVARVCNVANAVEVDTGVNP